MFHFCFHDVGNWTEGLMHSTTELHLQSHWMLKYWQQPWQLVFPPDSIWENAFLFVCLFVYLFVLDLLGIEVGKQSTTWAPPTHPFLFLSGPNEELGIRFANRAFLVLRGRYGYVGSSSEHDLIQCNMDQPDCIQLLPCHQGIYHFQGEWLLFPAPGLKV
jgi:hypothetical protein